MTIYDIAKIAGVSASTVSRVINKKGNVKTSTRLKIQKLLDDNNYYPNETARSLVNQASKIVGILVSDIRTSHHTEGAYIIERELAKFGYCSIIFNTGPDDFSKAECIRMLARRQVEAVVMIGSTFQSSIVSSSITQYLNNLPVVIENGLLDLPNVYCVLSDEKSGIANCVRFLAAKGRKKIAFINESLTPSNMEKQYGFITAINTLFPEQDPIVLNLGNSTLQNAYNTTQNLVKNNEDVDGIIYATDLTATSGVRALFDLNMSIPEHISVIGVDNSVYAEICNPRLTSLDNKLLESSVTCANLLFSVLNSYPVDKHTIVPTEIVERETT